MKRNNGFTLIEIMIVVVIVGILAAIGIIYYQQSVVTGRLVEAPTALSNWSAQIEQYYQDNHSYGTTATACGVTAPTGTFKYFTYTCVPCDLAASDTSRAGNYTTCTATAGAGPWQGYILTATSTNVTDTHVAGDWVFTMDDQGDKSTQVYHNIIGSPVTGCWFRVSGQRAC